jgi:hypothetical protein
LNQAIALVQQSQHGHPLGHGRHALHISAIIHSAGGFLHVDGDRFRRFGDRFTAITGRKGCCRDDRSSTSKAAQ